MAPAPDLPPTDEIKSARRRLFERRRSPAGGGASIGIAPAPRADPAMGSQLSALETIRDRLLADVGEMTARIAELEGLAEGAAEYQRRRALEDERERRERWAELERLAAARAAQRPALPQPRPESEVVGPAAEPEAATGVVEEAEPRPAGRRARRRSGVAAAVIAGVLLGAGLAAVVAAAVDDDEPAPARTVIAPAPKAVAPVALCSEVGPDADVTCDTGSRLFIAGQGRPADLGDVKARVTEADLVSLTASVDVALTATRATRITTDPRRLYLSIAGHRYAATPLDPIDLAAGATQTVTLQFVIDDPALGRLRANEGAADLGIVPPGAEPGTRLGVLRMTLPT